MTTQPFEPVARSLETALEAWYAKRRRRGASVPLSIATNSTLLAERAQPLLDLLAGRGIDTLEGRTLIDLGCGFGAMTTFFAAHGATAVGVDRKSVNFEVGRSVAAEHGLAVDLREGRMEAVDAPDAGFDVALLNNTLCYVTDPAGRATALAEARRLVRAGGIVLVVEPRLLPVDPFTRLPLVPYLSPAHATRVAARTGRTRPPVRLVSARKLRGELAAAGLDDVRASHAGRGGRYVRLSALRP